MGCTFLTALRCLGAGFVGFLVISLGTTLVLEVWFHNVTFHGSSTTVLVVSGLANFVVGIAGGVAAAALGGRWPLASAAAIGGFVTVDTIAILRSNRFDDPAWFTLLAGAGLLTAALLGGWLVRLYRERRNGESGTGLPPLLCGRAEARPGAASCCWTSRHQPLAHAGEVPAEYPWHRR